MRQMKKLLTALHTLQTLRDKGRLLELSLEPAKKRFDPNPNPHHHLICVTCKKIVDVTRTFDLSLPKNERHQFQLIGNHVDFYGICPECKTKHPVEQANKTRS